MRVTRLEIFGFKSFMDRLVLPLEGGITGVVGPNGCGKSNIVDAIRWILGESRASNLRGGVLEDVIFNGTDKLRPLGLAEVSITVRASGNNLLADISSPIIEIDELLEESLLDLGPAAKADTSLEEAEPAQTEEAKDETVKEENKERPKLKVISGGLDENQQVGAGIEEGNESDSGKSKDLVDAASLALRQFPWIQHATEVQITRRLYRSGDSEFFINRIPCRLKDIKDFFRTIGIAARGYTLVAQGEVARIVTAKPMDRRLILEEAAGVVGFRDKIASAQRRLDDTELNVSRINDIIKEVERQVGSLKRQADRARNRQALKDQLQERECALFSDSLNTFSRRQDEIETRLHKAKSEGERAETTMHAVASRETAARGDLMRVDIEGDTLRAKIDALKEELHNRARQRADTRSRIGELRAFALGKKTEIQRLEERRATLIQRKNDCANEIQKLEAQENEISLRLRAGENGAKEELHRLGNILQNLQQELRGKEAELRSLRDKLISRQSSLESIQEQLLNASPINRLEETAKIKNKDLLSKDLKMLIEGLIIPSELSKAVQAVLAERAAFLVAEDPHGVGVAFSHQVKEIDKDRKMGLGLGVFKVGSRTASIPTGIPFPSLLEAIRVDEAYEHAVGPLLEKCFVADDVDAAISFFKAARQGGRKLDDGFTLVTLDGEIVTSDSYFSFRQDGGLVQLRNRSIEIERVLKQLEAEQAELQGKRDALVESIASVEQRHKELFAEVEAQNALMRELSREQGAIRGKLQAEGRIREQIENDLEKVKVQVQEANAKISEYEQEEQIVTAQLEAIVSVDDEEIRKELDSLNSQYAGIDKIRKEGRSRLDSLSKEVQEARNALDAAHSEISRVELAAQRLTLEQDALKERILTEYGEDLLADLIKSASRRDPLDEESKERYQADVRRLRERILREGDVDPESVDRYEAEKERLIDLRTQRDDLEKAAITLKKTIVKLSDAAEKRFVSVFQAVEKNFARLIPQLFGGGKGSIALTDPSKPLDSGVEIMMRPPGKKPKSIDLLSGGEKALTAVALIFAMFLERPSPLCVLDEVDAPLDDANLIRFVSLVKEMSAKTQFIMITHNKQSMAVADRLVGVTMEEPGSSKVISVSLQEAYSQVA
ncbi:MAG: AAA family ATPase [SAR324 cluster bacterium]|uniref:Chromosome partition protein Smc n=1 Tax=SAR324 cluster bacterium TaxID=2024889 RepID=A0A7X9IL76_9DELT|nr:AAA family ATPase [SAR324 cluster bacterium]